MVRTTIRFGTATLVSMSDPPPHPVALADPTPRLVRSLHGMIDLDVPSKFGNGTMVRILKTSRQFAPQGVHKLANFVLAQNALHHNVSQVEETNFGLRVADPPRRKSRIWISPRSCG